MKDLIVKTKDLSFRTINDKSLEKINEWLPVAKNKMNSFNKKNSQTTLSLMTLQMLESGPYRTLRQILAQVERKRTALKENIYKLEKKKIRYNLLEKKKKKGKTNDYDELEMKKIVTDMVDAQGPIEAAMKELGVLRNQYEQVCKNKNIDPDWGEADFEQAEIEHHIKSAFRNAVRDRMQGCHNQGTMEYFESFGINPISAYFMVDQFIIDVRKAIKENKVPDIKVYHAFYDRMHKLFKNEYKKAMDRIGLDDVNHADYLFKDTS